MNVQFRLVIESYGENVSVSKKRRQEMKQNRLDNTMNTGYNAFTNGCNGRRKTWRRRLRRLLSYSR